jgi:hypothetical protein
MLFGRFAFPPSAKRDDISSLSFLCQSLDDFIERVGAIRKLGNVSLVIPTR